MKIYCLSLLFFLLSLACLAQNDSAKISVNDIVKGNTQFALDLFSKTKTASANFIFSPVSISTALALTTAGAVGETEKQMKAVLCFPALNKNLHAAFNALLSYYNTQLPGKQVELHMASALWLKSTAAFNTAYLKTTETNYGSVLFPLTTAGAVNAWSASQTNNRIKEILKEKDIAGAALIISNVIYFKAAWKEKFDSLNTKTAPFQTGGKAPVKVPFMNKTLVARYFENKAMQAIELPYAGDSLSMIVLLPATTTTLSALEQSFSAEKLKNLLDSLHNKKVKVSLPRFKLTTSTELQKPLTALGMGIAFNPSLADFSAMSDQKMFIAKVIHKAIIDVNEQGSEASAATHVTIGYTGVVTVPVFNANRPFLFIIKENKYNSILFMGHIINPKL